MRAQLLPLSVTGLLALNRRLDQLQNDQRQAGLLHLISITTSHLINVPTVPQFIAMLVVLLDM